MKRTPLKKQKQSNIYGEFLARKERGEQLDYKTLTKKERTFNIGGFKVVLTQSQYKKLYKISSVEDYFFEDDYNYYYVGEKYRGYDVTPTGLRTYVTVKTNKYVKVKLKAGKKTYYKKSRVYFIFSYAFFR